MARREPHRLADCRLSAIRRFRRSASPRPSYFRGRPRFLNVASAAPVLSGQSPPAPPIATTACWLAAAWKDVATAGIGIASCAPPPSGVGCAISVFVAGGSIV